MEKTLYYRKGAFEIRYYIYQVKKYLIKATEDTHGRFVALYMYNGVHTPLGAIENLNI
jgi:hypothetical protein